MKFNFLQSDFSAGELSPRSQGHIDSEAYKAGLALAANCFPTRAGSIASRAGGRLISDGFTTGAPGTNQGLVQHVPVQDGPNGDFIVEVGPTEIRLMDRFGVLPWNDIPNQVLQYTFQSANCWADPDTRTVHLSHQGIGTDTYILRSLAAGANPAAFPAGTNEQWTFSGFIAGSDVQVKITSSLGTVQTFIISPTASGAFSVVFTPDAVAGTDFAVQLVTTGVAVASTLWGMHLNKNANPLGAAHGLFLPMGVDRVRAAPCWVNMNLQGSSGVTAETPNFWTVFAGGPNNTLASYALRWQPAAGAVPSGWKFQQLPLAPGSLAQIQGSNAVAVYQDRIWFGRNTKGARPQLIASKIGYVDLFSASLTGAPANTHSTLFVFLVVAESYTLTGAFVDGREDWNIPDGAGTNFYDGVRFSIPAVAPPYPLDGGPARGANAAPRLVVYKNGVPVPTLPGPFGDYNGTPPAAGTRCITEAPATFFGGSLNVVGGMTWWRHTILAAGDVITFTTIPLATDPLVLNLASPAAKVAWLQVLRGLMMGTTQSEKLFAQGSVLAIDPATGESISLNDESNLGADERLNALNVNDKVLFVQRGRQVLRLANISITSDGGLVAEDVGIAGEHLTAARVRAMCFLKSPVQRIVLAMDDGTGAVLTLVGKSVAWSRFTLPAIFGGIYSVAALNGDRNSELWVGTDNGVTLQWDSFESDVQKTVLTEPAVFPAAPTRLAYDFINPLPPVMDGWARCGLANMGGVQWVTGLSTACVGQNVYVLINGQALGPYAAIADPSGSGAKVVLPAALNLASTWVDPNGVLQPQEVYAGTVYPAHRWTSLPLEGGNPVGTSQNLTSRKPQLYLRFVDSYLPRVNGTRCAERGANDAMDELGTRVTGDRRATELGFQRGDVVDVVMDLPLRMEVSAMFGGAVMNNV